MSVSNSNDSNSKVISDFSEISKLLSRFRSTRAIAKIDVLDKTYEGRINTVEDVTFTMQYKGLIPAEANTVEVNITSGHLVYNFRTSVLDIQDSEISLATPEEMRALVKRRYKRVRIESEDEASIEFTVISDNTNTQDTTKVVPKYAKIYEVLSKKAPDVKKIVQLILTQLRSYADESDIKLYKKGENFSTPVKIIRTLKETIFVKNTRNRSTYLTSTIPKVISLGTYLKHLKENGYNDEDIKKVMMKTIAEDQKRGVKSYIYSPIILFNEVIGHIYVANQKLEFNDQNVFITISMAEIISEAFVKTKLFQLESAGAIKGRIINISAGGALIEINDQYVMKFVHSSTKIKLTLTIEDVSGVEHHFNCKGKVLRVITNDRQNRVAIKFLDLRWNEHDAIDKIIRKKIEFQQALNT